MPQTRRVLMTVHAHPDDECFATGGILAHYAAEDVRTVLVTCTDGAVGEISDPSLATPDNLVEVRARELDASVRILKVSQLYKLGYRDSGMMGTADNQHPDAFQQANFVQALEKVVRIVRTERPQVLVTYDEIGGYGHPDHIRAQQVAVAAFDAAGDATRFPSAGAPWSPSRLFYAVVPRSAFEGMGQRLREAGIELPFSESSEGEPPPFGVDDRRVTTTIDVARYVDVKHQSMSAHATQMGPNMFFMRIPPALFADMFGREAFQLVRGPQAGSEHDLFDGL